MKRTNDPFERAKTYADCVRAQIKGEWAFCEDQIEQYLAKGETERANDCRQYYIERVARLKAELRDALLAMPPFLVKKDWYYERMAITEENQHLLRETT